MRAAPRRPLVAGGLRAAGAGDGAGAAAEAPGASIVLGELNGQRARLAPCHQRRELRRGAPRRRPLPRPRRGRCTPTPPTGPGAAGARVTRGRARRRLARRGGCAAGAPLWITETGAGAPHPGARRPAARPAQELEACRALAAACSGVVLRPPRGGRVPVHLPRRPGLPGGAPERRPAPAAPQLRACGWRSLAREPGPAAPAPAPAPCGG